MIRVTGIDCEPLVITAVGCSVLVAVGRRGAVLMEVASLRGHGVQGPRALAEGWNRTLQTVHDLPAGFVAGVTFDNPTNTRGFLDRLR